MSRRVHSRYERRLLDAAVGGCEVMVWLQVRRFLCLSAECGKKTFAEQVSGLTARHARRNPGGDRGAGGGRASAGRPGRRPAVRPASSRGEPDDAAAADPRPSYPAVSASPRVLGVDEFALRKGRSYGTLLAGAETRRPPDILDERSSDSFAAWLVARPGNVRSHSIWPLDACRPRGWPDQLRRFVFRCLN